MTESENTNGMHIITPQAGSPNATTTIDEVIDALLKYQPRADIDLVRRAYELANAAHSGQKRASGGLL